MKLNKNNQGGNFKFFLHCIYRYPMNNSITIIKVILNENIKNITCKSLLKNFQI